MSSQLITVNASPVPAQLWAALRQAIPPIIAFAIGRHLIGDDTATLILALAGIAATVTIGQAKTRKNAVNLASVAANPAVPDSIITTK